MVSVQHERQLILRHSHAHSCLILLLVQGSSSRDFQSHLASPYWHFAIWSGTFREPRRVGLCLLMLLSTGKFWGLQLYLNRYTMRHSTGRPGTSLDCYRSNGSKPVPTGELRMGRSKSLGLVTRLGQYGWPAIGYWPVMWLYGWPAIGYWPVMWQYGWPFIGHLWLETQAKVHHQAVVTSTRKVLLCHPVVGFKHYIVFCISMFMFGFRFSRNVKCMLMICKENKTISL